MLHDLRQALRNLRRSPWAGLVIVLSLALGTGANAAVYSAVDALLLRAPAGVTGASGLVDIYTSQFNGGTYGESSSPDVASLLNAPELAGVALLDDRRDASVAFGPTSAIARVAAVSERVWSVLQIQPSAGAWPTRAVGGVVVSDHLWRSLGAPANIPGASITIDRQAFTIAAVAPPSFRGLHLDRIFDVWVPVDATTMDRGDRHFAVIGRLAPNATVEGLQASLDAISRRLAGQYPSTNIGTLRRPDEARRFTAIRYSRFDPSVRRQLPLIAAALFFATGLLLLSACVNAGSLLLSRGLARRVEMTVKIALGADRWRLVREGLFEAVAVAIAGSIAGLVAAAWISRAIPALFAPEHASLLDVHVDRPVMLVELAVGALAGVAFGLLPALVATRALSPELLRSDVSHVGEGQRGVRLRMVLAGAQLALSTVFLIGWTVLGHVTSTVLSQAAPSHVGGAFILASIENQGPAFRAQAAATLLENPSIALVGWIATPPLGRAVRREFRLDAGAVHERFESDINFASADYFRASYTPIVYGRFPSLKEERDRSALMVNEAFALRFLGPQPVGQTLTDASGRSLRVVGVVMEHSYSAFGGPSEPMVYYPMSLDSARYVFAAVRFRPFASGAAAQTGEALRRAGVSRVNAMTLEQFVASALAGDRIITALIAGCGLLALVLAVIGVASVMADAGRRRAREMGLRAALGARSLDLARALLGSSLMPAFAGLAAGAAVAVVAWKAVLALVYGVPSVDAASIGEIFAGLSVIVIAAVLPAVVRAIRVNPLRALKEL